MLVSIKTTTIFLLSFILQSGACSTNSHNNASIESLIGQLSGAAVCEKTLDSDIKDRIFSILERASLYERFLKKIGADPKLNLKPIQLSLEQQKAWHKVYLLFIDLYKLFCEATKLMVVKWNSECDLEKALENLSKESLDFMEFIFSVPINFSTNGYEVYENEHERQMVTALKKLWDTIQQYYIEPFNKCRYINGKDWVEVEKSIDIGRAKTYQAIIECLSEIEKNQS